MDRDLRLVRLAAFTSTFDRFAIPPMLLTIAGALDVSLARVAVAASAYYLLYGLMQPAWGVLSDRIGRVRLMRLALAAGAAGGIVSALAPSLAVLVAARAVTGGLFGAVIPASLVYVGDTVPARERQHALATLMGATAIGTALATVVAGALAAWASWRLGFALPAAGAALLAVLLRRVREPEREPSQIGALAKMGRVGRHPWALAVIGLTLVEGFVAFGAIPYLAPALESTGHSAAVAGLAAALFGIAMSAWTQVVKRALGRWRPSVLMAAGGSWFALGYGAAAVTQGIAGIAAAALLVGGGFAFLHTGLQAWATEVAPEARATTIAFFASGLFVGSALATGLLGPIADDERYALLFGLCAACTFPLGIAAAAARERYERGRRSTRSIQVESAG